MKEKMKEMIKTVLEKTASVLDPRMLVTETMVTGYYELLEEYPLSVIIDVFKTCRTEDSYFPKPHQIISMIKKIIATGKEIADTNEFCEEKWNKTQKQKIYSDEQEKNRDERRQKKRGREMIDSTNTDWVLPKLEEMEDNYYYPEERIMSGFYRLDTFIDGFGRGEYIVIGARPSTGKSAITTSIVAHNMELGVSTGVFVLESTIDNYMNRLYAIRTGLLVNGFRKGYHVTDSNVLQEIRICMNNMITKEGKIFFSKENRLDNMLVKIEKMVANDCKLIIVDHIGKIIAGVPGNENQQMSHVSRSLASIASRLDITMIVLSQLSRDGKDRLDKSPLLTDLRSSGSLEQDADIVLLLHRAHNEMHETSLEIAKNRDGRRGRIKLYFDGSTVSFKEME